MKSSLVIGLVLLLACLPQAAEAILFDLLDGILDSIVAFFCSLPLIDLLCKNDALRVDYYEGFNVNMEITEEQARSLMPSSQFTPVPMKVLNDEDPGVFMLSWYVAVLAGNFVGFETQSKRADLFSYAIDPFGELCIVLVGAIMEVPEFLLDNPWLLDLFKQAVEDLALDSRTGTEGYPHFYASTFEITGNGFQIAVGDQTFGISSIECTTPAVSTFSLEFVNANSQAYRSPIDKHVNYFNQDFVDANVLILGEDCLVIENFEAFVEFNPDGMGLMHSAQYYGSSEIAISWFFEDVTTDATP